MGTMISLGAALEHRSATIATGGTESGAIDVNGRLIVGVSIPAGFDGTSLAIKNSVDGTTYLAEYDTSGTAVTWTVAHSRFIRCEPPLAGYNSIKLVAGEQTGAITLTVVLLP